MAEDWREPTGHHYWSRLAGEDDAAERREAARLRLCSWLAWISTIIDRTNGGRGGGLDGRRHPLPSRPILYAATAPEAVGGGYYGPAGWIEWSGPPATARVSAEARDRSVAERLWRVSEELTGLAFDPGADPPVAQR